MHQILTLLRLMTHVNIGAAIALVAWLVTQSYVPDGSNTSGAGPVHPAATASTGAAQ